mgnify:CR=1 FL=1
MDGMPLTADQIRTFYDRDNLEEMLNHLVNLGYLVYEHPKKRVAKETDSQTRTIYERFPDETKPRGYNIVAGKLSFEFSRILDPNGQRHPIHPIYSNNLRPMLFSTLLQKLVQQVSFIVRNITFYPQIPTVYLREN